MMIRRLLWVTVLVASFAAVGAKIEAQQSRLPQIESSNGERQGILSGLITEHLSPKQLKRWQEIEQLVLAEDEDGQPLHPTLRGLWQWAEMSQHAIYLEMLARSNRRSTLAGSFQIQKYDPEGKRHVALIRLSLSNIDRAYVGPLAAYADGFIPFQGLSQKERYAEVLGHELAHAKWALSKTERVRQGQELVEQTNELLLSHNQYHGDRPFGAELRRRLLKRDSFLVETEAEAEAVEAVIWQELIASQQARARN